MDNIVKILDKLRTLSGNDQIDELKKHKDNLMLKEILTYTYDSHRKYKINQKKLDKIMEDTISEIIPVSWDSFKVDILDYMLTKKASTDSDVIMAVNYINNFPLEQSRVIIGVLLKDLHLGLNKKSINKAFEEETMKEGSVILAKDFDGKLFEDSLISRKVDGKRGYFKQGKAYGRSDKEFKYEPIKHIIKQLNTIGYDFVYDGEFAFLDSDYKEDFQKTVSLLSDDKRKEGCDNLYYILFDRIKLQDFEDKSSSIILKETYNKLLLDLATTEIVDSNLNRTGLIATKYPNILIFEQDSNECLPELLELYKKQKWEGLVIRNNVPYDFKRTGNFRRLKAMQDAEFPITGFNQGKTRTKYANTLGSVTIKLPTGDEVDVGSGYSDSDRDILWKKRWNILELGLYAKVQYFTITKDKKGKTSLRFPVFICLRHPITMEEFPLNEL